MFKNLFKKSVAYNIEEFIAPISGKIVDITEVPDPVFCEKMMGDGVAIIPTEGTVAAPVEGEVIQIFKTKHVIAIRSKNGVEIMIHIGLETVKLDGEGFEVYVKEGENVKVGQKLLTFDLKNIINKSFNTICPIAIINGDEKVVKLEKSIEGDVVKGNSLIMKVEFK